MIDWAHNFSIALAFAAGMATMGGAFGDIAFDSAVVFACVCLADAGAAAGGALYHGIKSRLTRRRRLV